MNSFLIYVQSIW